MLNKRISASVLALSILAMSLPYTNVAQAKTVSADNKKVAINDIKNHWAKNELNYFYNKGLLTAYSDGTLRPEKTVTRAEFVTFVNRVMGYDKLTVDRSVAFKDVSNNDWFGPEIARAVRVGYISPNSQNFRPNDMITRQEAAVMLTNIFNNKDIQLDKLANYKDGSKVAEWAKTAVEGAIEAGYIKGYSTNELKPAGKVTRADMATMLYRASIGPTDLEGHWAETELRYFMDNEMLTVYSNNTIRPNKTVTRAEFVSFVNRVLGYDKSNEGIVLEKSIKFKDVSKDSWFATDIEIALKEGYITSASSFRPNDGITREEAAVILTNIFKNKDTKIDKVKRFEDAKKISKWAESSVEGAVEAGYLIGRSSKKLCPTEVVTRAEMATMLYRTYDKPVDIKGHWAKNALEYYFYEGILKADGNKTMNPDRAVTRAEFVAFVNKALGYDKMPATSNSYFKDVTSDHWFANDVAIAVRAGYISAGTSFRPNDKITRQEAAVILTNIFNNKDSKIDKISKFKDYKKVPTWAKEALEGAVEAGYMQGYDDKTIKPTSSVSKAEMATMLYRAQF